MTRDVKVRSMDMFHVGAFHSPSSRVYPSLLLFLLDDDLSITISSISVHRRYVRILAFGGRRNYAQLVGVHYSVYSSAIIKEIGKSSVVSFTRLAIQILEKFFLIRKHMRSIAILHRASVPATSFA